MRNVIVALAFVAAFVAVVFGLRRLRAAPQTVARGPWSRLRATFWLAAAALLGSGACATDDDVVDDSRVEDGFVECYADSNEAGYEDHAEFDAEADAEVFADCYAPADDGEFVDRAEFDADADVEPEDDVEQPLDADAGSDTEPDAGPDIDPEASTEAETPEVSLAPPAVPADPRWERWAVRTELRARTVAALLADPGTATVVRDELAREERRLRRRVAVIKARRRRPSRPSTPAGGRGSL